MRSYLFALPWLVGCQTAEQAFLGQRLPVLCDEAYAMCDVTAQCVVDEDHYVNGTFPGVRRVVVDTATDKLDILARVFLQDPRAPGSEIIVQLYDSDCTLAQPDGQVHLEDVDVIHEAGDDHALDFELHATGKGEHLLEVYSDASSEFLLLYEPL